MLADIRSHFWLPSPKQKSGSFINKILYFTFSERSFIFVIWFPNVMVTSKKNTQNSEFDKNLSIQSIWISFSNILRKLYTELEMSGTLIIRIFHSKSIRNLINCAPKLNCVYSINAQELNWMSFLEYFKSNPIKLCQTEKNDF